MDVTKDPPKNDPPKNDPPKTEVGNPFVEETLDKVLALVEANEFNKVIKLLLHLLKPKNKKKLLVEQEIYILLSLSTCYRSLSDLQTALFYGEKGIELLKEKFGSRSVKYVMKVPTLLVVYRGLKDNVKLREVIAECLSIMEELKLTWTEEYALMLKELANINYTEKHFKESLEIYERAKLISEEFKDNDNNKKENYTKVLTNIAMCHRKLNRWNEGIKLMKEAIELIKTNLGNKHHLYGVALYNLASIYSDLKSYNDALPLLEEIVAIQGGTLVANDQLVGANKFLSMVRKNISNSHPELIDVGHAYRMCNTCKIVIDDMDSCTGCFRVSYCGKECQLKDWSNHKPLCHVCFACDASLDRDSKILRCSKCKKVKYCNSECQKADWKDHKKVCIPSTN